MPRHIMLALPADDWVRLPDERPPGSAALAALYTTACRRLWVDVFLASVTDAWKDPRDGWIAPTCQGCCRGVSEVDDTLRRAEDRTTGGYSTVRQP